MTRPASIMVRDLGTQDYLPVYEAMSQFTAERDEHSADEFWLVEHPPVFTQAAIATRLICSLPPTSR